MLTRRVCALSAAAALAVPGRAVASESDDIGITGALGFTYLPTYVVLERKLIEKHCARLQISPKVTFQFVSTGGAINDAMLSDSADVAPIGGGHGTLCTIAATSKFHDQRPISYAAVKAAYDEAILFINEDKRGTAEIYTKWEPNRKGAAWIQNVLENEKFVKYTRDPHLIGVYGDFIYKLGLINKPLPSWRDLFFDNGAGLAGS